MPSTARLNMVVVVLVEIVRRGMASMSCLSAAIELATAQAAR